MMKTLGSILPPLLGRMLAAALLVAGCERNDSMRLDEQWPNRPEVVVVADSALADPLQEMQLGINNVDSTLRLLLALASPESIGTGNDFSDGSGIVLYGTIHGDSGGILPTAMPLGEIAEGSPLLVAGEPLVLLASIDSPLAMSAPVDLKEGRFQTIAAVTTDAPDGRLTELALRRLGLRDTLAGRLLPAGSGRDVIDMISSGRAMVGITTGSQARRFEGRTKILDTISIPRPNSDAREIPLIRYYALMLRRAPDSSAAARMMAWLIAPDIQRVFNHYGFARRDSILLRDRGGNGATIAPPPRSAPPQ